MDVQKCFDINDLLSEQPPDQFFVRLWTVQNTIDALGVCNLYYGLIDIN